MIRGTTPTITCTFPYAVSSLSAIRIYFIQGNETLLTKKETDCTFNGYNASVTLTEEETFLFTAKKRLEIKVRYLKTDGNVCGTRSKFVDVYDTGDEAILISEDDNNE